MSSISGERWTSITKWLPVPMISLNVTRNRRLSKLGNPRVLRNLFYHALVYIIYTPCLG